MRQTHGRRRRRCSRKLAWRFPTNLVWREDIKKILDRISAQPWRLFDSDRRDDFISGQVTPHASLTIILYRGACSATLYVDDPGGAVVEQHLDEAKQRVLSEILPALGARDVREIEPPKEEP